MAQVENTILKSYDLINHCYRQAHDSSRRYDDTIYFDSLSNANDWLADTIVKYATKYPETINYHFKKLDSAGVNATVSTDKKLKIYSWDTGLGGSRYIVYNVYQFLTPKGMKAGQFFYGSEYEDNEDDDYEINGYCSKIQTLELKNRKIYIAYFHNHESGCSQTEVLKAFEINDSDLVDTACIFEGPETIDNMIGFDYASCKIPKGMDDNALIRFSKDIKVMKIPQTTFGEQIIRKYDVYRFNGEYYEAADK